jgi:hypothetical protein
MDRKASNNYGVDAGDLSVESEDEQLVHAMDTAAALRVRNTVDGWNGLNMLMCMSR